ncbi:MAG: flagellar biosynthetic protein FliO [Gammaproteobacteria bacterium]|nr:flagellar biosynthetic protein FliO [Gammaproteobacteria bacterium]
MQRAAYTITMLLPGAVRAADSVVPGPAVGDVAISLAGIVVLIIALAWGLRRLRMPGAASSAGGIKVVTALAVGTRERIVLLQVGDQQLLVGMGPGHMQTLHVLNEPLPDSLGSNAGMRGAEKYSDFAGKLRAAIAGRQK